MSDDLTISGGGSLAVATAELFSQGRQLESLGETLDRCRARLTTADREIGGLLIRNANAPVSTALAEHSLDDAIRCLYFASTGARMLAASLGASAHAYGLLESSLQHFHQELAAKLGYGLGFLFPGLALIHGPRVLAVGAGVLGGVALSSEAAKQQLLVWLQEHTQALSDPQVVEMVRLAVMSADDFGAGLMRLDPRIAGLLGDEGLGLLGIATSAGAMVGVSNRFGALAETPVAVRRRSERRSEGVAQSFEERVARIPQGESQVRIDSYEVPGEPTKYEVYLGGTKDFALVAADDPWDMTSNVNALALGDAGSYRAVQEAMHQAGIDPDSEVTFTGHSQGGLIAALLAASGDYNVQGVLTVGGPVGLIDVPASVPWVAISHDEDLVPALGGVQKSPDAIWVGRRLFENGDVPTDVPLPAHEVWRYEETAALLDKSNDGRSGDALKSFNNLAEGAEGVSTRLYTAERVPG